MSYQFPSDIQAKLNAFLEAGTFRTEDDVIRTAIDALEQIEAEKLKRWHERNRLAEQQSAAGMSRPLDEQQVLARLRERLANGGILD